MVEVFVSVGSNVDRENNVVRAVRRLEDEYGGVTASSVYESAAVGFDGPPFLNLVVRFTTNQPLAAVVACLKRIETESCRTHDGPRFSDRTLDLDLLLYGDCCIHNDVVDVPREEITAQAFILCPLAEIAPDKMHPEQQVSFASLWSRFDKPQQNIAVCQIDGLS